MSRMSRTELEEKFFAMSTEIMVLKSKLNKYHMELKNLRNYYTRYARPGNKSEFGLEIINKMDEQLKRIMGIDRSHEG